MRLGLSRAGGTPAVPFNKPSNAEESGLVEVGCYGKKVLISADMTATI